MLTGTSLGAAPNCVPGGGLCDEWPEGHQLAGLLHHSACCLTLWRNALPTRWSGESCLALLWAEFLLTLPDVLASNKQASQEGRMAGETNDLRETPGEKQGCCSVQPRGSCDKTQTPGHVGGRMGQQSCAHPSDNPIFRLGR
jgi:hypothetical protein